MNIKPKLCIVGIGLIVLSLSLFLAQGYNTNPQDLTQEANKALIYTPIEDASLNAPVIEAQLIALNASVNSPWYSGILG